MSKKKPSKGNPKDILADFKQILIEHAEKELRREMISEYLMRLSFKTATTQKTKEQIALRIAQSPKGSYHA